MDSEENMTHDDIIKKHFRRSLFGYDPIEVDRFLDELIRELDRRDAKIDELIGEIAALENGRAETEPEDTEQKQIKILIMPENAEDHELPAVLRKPEAQDNAAKEKAVEDAEETCEVAFGETAETESGEVQEQLLEPAQPEEQPEEKAE